MTALAFPTPLSGFERDQWGYLSGAFGANLIMYGSQEEDSYPIRWADQCDSLTNLPDGDLVLLQPKSGVEVQGEVSLIDFAHPPQAIYCFGGNDINLTNEKLAGRSFQKVYIPQHELELYSWMAAAIVLYDRMVKNG